MTTKKLMLEYADNILSLKTTGIITPEIHNISTQHIDHNQIQSLSLGHKFIPTPLNNPNLSLKAWNILKDPQESNGNLRMNHSMKNLNTGYLVNGNHLPIYIIHY